MKYLIFLCLILVSPCSISDEYNNENEFLTFNHGLSAYESGDYSTAMRFLPKVAYKENFILADIAKVIIGEIHYKDEGGFKDLEKSFKLTSKAANNGYDAAQFKLAIFYKNGIVVKQDTQKAHDLFKLAANQGHQNAQFMLGLSYYSGIGVPQNYKNAIYWFDNAANQGEVNSQYWLGRMYFNGDGVPVNNKEAFKWFELAAKQGHALSQHLVGLAYERNLYGFEKDYVKAHMWLNVSVANGRNPKYRDALEKEMTESQIQEAQDMAIEFFEKTKLEK